MPAPWRGSRNPNPERLPLNLPQVVLPTALYNAILCSLIVMASWHLISIADGLRRHFFARGNSDGQR